MDEKRTVCGYEVHFAMHIGEREVVFLLDPASVETPYMVAYCEGNSNFVAERLVEVVGGGDYLEAVEEFMDRVQLQIDQVRTERERTNEPQEVLGKDHCLPSDGIEQDLRGRVVVIRPSALTTDSS